MTATPYPLQWPASRPRTPQSSRKAPQFHATKHNGSSRQQVELTIKGSLQRLQIELDRIGARYPVVSSNVETRLDGLPRSDRANPADPGVAVYFQLRGKPICFPCDRYKTVAGNIAAIAKHIEATRAIERYGVATVSEMFSGFAQIEAPGSKAWWDVLMCRPDATKDVIQAQYKRLASERHPDRPNGSHSAMAELNAARDEALWGK